MDSAFWKNKKVLITGHTGFKGSWLSLWLQTKGVNTIGYSPSPPTKPSLFEIANVSDGMISITGDVRDLDHLKSIIAEHKPEIVIHMAAQSLVRYSYNNPAETYSTNIMGTMNVLEAARCSDVVRVVVNITSDKCYENREWLWGYRENEAMGGHDPYSSSKGCAELITSAYRRSYFSDDNLPGHGVAVATARAGNVVGGGDWAADRLIPDIMNAIMEKNPVIIRYPNAIRPWQHVLEPLCGYIDLAEELWHYGNEFAGAWNFGPNDEDARSVSWVADRLTNLWGDGASWKTDSIQQPHEATYLKLDCSKAKSLLGWSPKLDLTTNLQWIVEWYRAYLQKKDMRRVTEAEIVQYEKLF
ncbi:MAG: CDP-glucose 4,6-dehydratase [Thermodesulfovibrionales bacterium]|nr:CDP-glucose 4,6-dehydratase [Thermodesulfovibrionales bacterium]